MVSWCVIPLTHYSLAGSAIRKKEDLILICLKPPRSSECRPVLALLHFRVPSSFETIDVGECENDMWREVTH